ncbi:MAG: hypothetical protein DPW14_09625 [Planctomycetes bacterium]|nr:hypothetical protein [Planctomycetota bacterium]
MDDGRNKTVRIDDQLNKAVKALAGYFDSRADEVVAKAITLLWEKTFPGVAMPAQEPTAKKRK